MPRNLPLRSDDVSRRCDLNKRSVFAASNADCLQRNAMTIPIRIILSILRNAFPGSAALKLLFKKKGGGVYDDDCHINAPQGQ
jgi:hypothetical protein